MHVKKLNMSLFVISFMQLLLVALAASVGFDNLKMAVVNDDAQVTDGNCPYKDSCSMRNLSCRYLAHLKKQSVDEEYHECVAPARRAVQRSEVAGAIHMGENFTDAFVAKMALGEDSDDETIAQAQMRVWLGAGDQPTADTTKQRLEAAFSEFITDLLAQCGMDPDRFTFKEPFHYV